MGKLLDVGINVETSLALVKNSLTENRLID
jgi:hypothetical protein